MVLDRPQHVEAELVGEPRQAQLLVPDLLIADVAPAVAGEDHLNADIHAALLAAPACSRRRRFGSSVRLFRDRHRRAFGRQLADQQRFFRRAWLWVLRLGGEPPIEILTATVARRDGVLRLTEHLIRGTVEANVE